MGQDTYAAEEQPRQRTFYVRLGLGAIVLILAAVAVTLIDQNAPSSFFEIPNSGTAIFALFITALIAAAAQRFVGWRRGVGVLEARGPARHIAIAVVLFHLALLGALVALGVVTGILSLTGSPPADLLFRACLVLLIGGMIVALAGAVLRDLLYLALSWRR